MKYFLILLSIFFPPEAFAADTYLCVGEAGAGVEHGGNKGIHAETYNVSNKKYILSNERGMWKFRELGEDLSHLECSSEFYCEGKGGFSAIFFKDKNSGIFTYIYLVMLDEKFSHQFIYTIKGRCSKL